MFERELTLYEFQLNYLRLLAADLEDGQMQAAPFEGANPPVWILGHLAVATDYAAGLLGQRPVLPREWHKQFGPGSQPSALERRCPAKANWSPPSKTDTAAWPRPYPPRRPKRSTNRTPSSCLSLRT